MEDDDNFSVVSLATRRRRFGRQGGVDSSGPIIQPAKRMRQQQQGDPKQQKQTQATKWMETEEAQGQEWKQFLAAHISMLPEAVLLKVRFFHVGHGGKIRDCLLCGESSQSPDPILGEHVMLMWGHLADDGITILGLIDWYCVGVMRRRWTGWKLQELSEHFQLNPAERAKHKGWRLLDIEFIRQNGFAAQVTAHTSDGGIDRTRRSVRTKHDLVETFHLGQDLLWPTSTFTSYFEMTPSEAGYQIKAYPLPDGGKLVGVRVPHDPNLKDVPNDVVRISKDFKVEVAISENSLQQCLLGSVGRGFEC